VTGFVVLLLFFGAVGIALCVFVRLSEPPEVQRTWFGKVDELPADFGEWHADTTSPEALAAAVEGLEREERLFCDTRGGLGAGRLVRQVRYRARETGEILRADPDAVVRRRRPR
jgi:hypothetical protein